MSNLLKRVLFALVGIPVFLGVLYLGGIWLCVTMIVLSTISIYEFVNMYKQKGVEFFSVPMYVSNIVSLVIIYLADSEIINFFSVSIYEIFAVLFLINLLFSLAIRLIHSPQNFGYEVGVQNFGMQYITFGYISMMLYDNLIPVFLAIWANDTFAYFTGRKFGKNKLSPHISPNKTIEGFLGGIIGSGVVMCASSPLISGYGKLDFALFVYDFIIGVLIGIFATIGDLIESAIKRDCGVKDSSNLIPGHGGVLDRFDSALFVFPVFYIVMKMLRYISESM